MYHAMFIPLSEVDYYCRQRYGYDINKHEPKKYNKQTNHKNKINRFLTCISFGITFLDRK